jgi:hypothetical protein
MRKPRRLTTLLDPRASYKNNFTLIIQTSGQNVGVDSTGKNYDLIKFVTYKLKCLTCSPYLSLRDINTSNEIYRFLDDLQQIFHVSNSSSILVARFYTTV